MIKTLDQQILELKAKISQENEENEIILKKISDAREEIKKKEELFQNAKKQFNEEKELIDNENKRFEQELNKSKQYLIEKEQEMLHLLGRLHVFSDFHHENGDFGNIYRDIIIESNKRLNNMRDLQASIIESGFLRSVIRYEPFFEDTIIDDPIPKDPFKQIQLLNSKINELGKQIEDTRIDIAKQEYLLEISSSNDYQMMKNQYNDLQTKLAQLQKDPNLERIPTDLSYDNLIEQITDAKHQIMYEKSKNYILKFNLLKQQVNDGIMEESEYEKLYQELLEWSVIIQKELSSLQSESNATWTILSVLKQNEDKDLKKVKDSLDMILDSITKSTKQYQEQYKWIRQMIDTICVKIGINPPVSDNDMESVFQLINERAIQKTGNEAEPTTEQIERLRKENLLLSKQVRALANKSYIKSRTGKK